MVSRREAGAPGSQAAILYLPLPLACQLTQPRSQAGAHAALGHPAPRLEGEPRTASTLPCPAGRIIPVVGRGSRQPTRQGGTGSTWPLVSRGRVTPPPRHVEEAEAARQEP